MFVAFVVSDAIRFDFMIGVAGLDCVNVAVPAQFVLVVASIQIHFCDLLYDLESHQINFRLAVQLKQRLKRDFFPPPFSFVSRAHNFVYIHSNNAHHFF